MSHINRLILCKLNQTSIHKSYFALDNYFFIYQQSFIKLTLIHYITCLLISLREIIQLNLVFTTHTQESIS